MIHNLPTCRLLTVEVPEEAVNFDIDFDGVTLLCMKESWVHGSTIKLPPGNWTLLGRVRDISYETWSQFATASSRSLIVGNPVVLIERKKE